MKRALLIAGGLGVVVLGAVFLYPRPVDRPGPAPQEASTSPTGAGTTKAAPSGRRLIPDKLPHERKAAEAAEAPGASGGKAGGESSITADPEARALVGLEVLPMDDGLREKLKVPDDSQIGYGVVVGSIHPDAPAAEIAMRRNDVIVRANLKKVDSPEDLERLVGDRFHTLITISRGGELMQMVLKKPYRGK